jgi:hypothetical protein
MVRGLDAGVKRDSINRQSVHSHCRLKEQVNVEWISKGLVKARMADLEYYIDAVTLLTIETQIMNRHVCSYLMNGSDRAENPSPMGNQVETC